MKKSPLLCLVLALLLVCSVSVAFAAGPKEAAPELTVIELLSDATPEEISGQLEERMHTRMMEEVRCALELTSEAPTAQSDCPHLHTTSLSQGTLYTRMNASVHEKKEFISKLCLDCQKGFIEETTSVESHSFGSSSYIGSNHASLDPSNHTFTYSHTCVHCPETVQYTVPSGCRKGNCVDPHSLTPEPEIASVSP